MLVSIPAGLQGDEVRRNTGDEKAISAQVFIADHIQVYLLSSVPAIRSCWVFICIILALSVRLVKTLPLKIQTQSTSSSHFRLSVQNISTLYKTH